jgi:hypothetical protein
MTHHDDASTFADVLAPFGDDGTKELFRRLLEHTLQDLIDAEVTAKIGVALDIIVEASQRPVDLHLPRSKVLRQRVSQASGRRCNCWHRVNVSACGQYRCARSGIAES